MFSFQQGDFDDVKLKAKLCPLVSFSMVSVVLWNLIEKSFNEFALFKVIPLLKESNSKGYLSYDYQFFYIYIYSDPSISYMYVRLGCSDICYCDFRLHKKIVSFLYAHIYEVYFN